MNTIMVVDDVEQLARNYATLFEKRGWQAQAALSGEEAIEHAQRQRFDVVLLDIRMPRGIDGFETLHKLLEIQPDTAVVFITAYGDVARARPRAASAP